MSGSMANNKTELKKSLTRSETARRADVAQAATTSTVSERDMRAAKRSRRTASSPPPARSFSSEIANKDAKRRRTEREIASLEESVDQLQADIAQQAAASTSSDADHTAEHDDYSHNVAYPEPLIQEKPRKPLRPLEQIPKYNLNERYANYGDIKISGVDILRTLEPEWFSGDLILASLGHLTKIDLRVSENVCYTNTQVFTNICRGGMMNYHVPITRESVDTVLWPNAKRAAGFLKSLDVFSKKLFLMPLIYGNHWMLVAILNPINCLVAEGCDHNRMSAFYFLDPMGNMKTMRNLRVKCLVVAFLLAHLKALQRRIKNPLYERMRFCAFNLICAEVDNIPLQTNFSDCGPTIIYYMEAILNPFTGFMNQEYPLNIDWNEVAPKASVETIRSRVRSRILNSAISPSDKKALKDIVERGEREGELARTRRSRSAERNTTRRRYKRRCYSLDRTLFTNPAEFCRHPVPQLVGQLIPYVDHPKLQDSYYH